MTTIDATVLKQALEVLELANRTSYSESNCIKFSEAIKSIRAAIAQPVQTTPQSMQEYGDARVQAYKTARQAEQGPPPAWMQNIDVAMQEPLFQALRGMMGTENIGQNIALLQTIRHYRAIAQPVPQAELTDGDIKQWGLGLLAKAKEDAMERSALAAFNEHFFKCTPTCTVKDWTTAWKKAIAFWTAIAQPVPIEGDAKDANSEDVLWQLLNAVTDEMNRRAIPGTWLSLAYKTGSEFITNHRAAIASKKGAA